MPLYIEKVEIWSGGTDALLTHSPTLILKDKSRSGALVTQSVNCEYISVNINVVKFFHKFHKIRV